VVGVGYRPRSSSFTSSHAANHFGIAVFCFFTLRQLWGKYVYLFLLWAASICFTQVYVGVHYPLDVFCGGILGSAIGTMTAYFFFRTEGMLQTHTPKDMQKPI
jgi:membrane-associated phospholipid phosphatase